MGHDGGGQRIGFLDMQEMAGLRHDRDAGAGNHRGDGVAVAGGQEIIVVAPDDMRRHVDPVQPFRQMGIVQPRLPGEPGEGRPVLEPGVVRLDRLGQPGNRGLGKGLGHARADAGGGARNDGGLARKPVQGGNSPLILPRRGAVGRTPETAGGNCTIMLLSYY